MWFYNSIIIASLPLWSFVYKMLCIILHINIITNIAVTLPEYTNVLLPSLSLPPVLFSNCIIPSSSLHWYTTISSTSSYLCPWLIRSPPPDWSQRPQVVARAGFLPQELAHLSLSRVAGHQTGQEAFGAGGNALTLASAQVVSTGPRGPWGQAPAQPHRTLQELRGAVIQRGGDLQVQAVEEGSAGQGLWEEREEVGEGWMEKSECIMWCDAPASPPWHSSQHWYRSNKLGTCWRNYQSYIIRHLNYFSE